jgi:hypothetical protein
MCDRAYTVPPMKIEVELPDKYATKLDEIEAVEPTIEDQIEVEVLPEILRMINDAHRQLEERDADRVRANPDDGIDD